MFADTIHRDYQTWESTLQISPGEVRGYKITFQKYKYLKELKKKTVDWHGSTSVNQNGDSASRKNYFNTILYVSSSSAAK